MDNNITQFQEEMSFKITNPGIFIKGGSHIKAKETCRKHHEYVSLNGRWVCRFCNRNINQSVKTWLKRQYIK